jgi:hypothetical protein
MRNPPKPSRETVADRRIFPVFGSGSAGVRLMGAFDGIELMAGDGNEEAAAMASQS